MSSNLLQLCFKDTFLEACRSFTASFLDYILTEHICLSLSSHTVCESSTILGDKVSGWLESVAHGMHDITRESMRPSEELENESEMTLELFGVAKQLAMTSHSPTTQLDSNTMHAAGSSSKNPTTPPSK